MNLEKVKEASLALLKMKTPGRVKVKSPTKKDLNRSFKMEVNDKEKPSIKEVV